MEALISLVVAVVPILVYLKIIWLMDRYDREPVGLLLGNFLWGAFGAVLFAVIISIKTSELLMVSDYHSVVVIAPVIEEITKGVFLLWTVRRRSFDNMTDGMVYGMAIGLGFGMTENFIYFYGAETGSQWLFLVIVRTFFTAIMHAMSTGILGALIGLGKYRLHRFRYSLLISGFVLAVFMHFFWNYSVSINSLGAVWMAALFIALSLIVILVVLQLSLLDENRMLLRELGEEVELGVIPSGHLEHIAYARKRKLEGWLPEGVQRKQYIQLATSLAFRKQQSRWCRAEQREGLENEIASLRQEISRRLSPDDTGPTPDKTEHTSDNTDHITGNDI